MFLDKRNRVVHDPWGEHPTAGPVKFTITVDKKLTFGYENYSVDQMIHAYQDA